MVRAGLCLATVVLSASALVAQAPAPARDTPNAGHGTARIRGRVVDVATARGLSRVLVRAGGVALRGTPRVTFTDGDGRFELDDLPAGSYFVGAEKANYLTITWGQERPQGPGKWIPVVAGQTVEGINLALRRAGAITGKIVDEFGDPVTDTAVTALRYQFIEGSRRLASAGRGGTTNDIGEFRVYGLPPGQYFLSANFRSFSAAPENERSSYAPTFYPGSANVAEAQRLTLAPGQTLAGINVTLLPVPTAKISGSVVDSEGNPVTGLVRLMQRSGSLITSGAVQPIGGGRFTISGVTGGDYIVQVGGTAGTPESITTDLTVTGSDIDLKLALAKPATIRGRIVFAGEPARSRPPRPSTLDMGAVREWALGQQTRSAATIRDDGSFEIPLPAGRVVLRVAPAGGSGGPTGPPPWRLNRVVANDLDVADTGIDVPPGGAIDNVVVELTNRTGEIAGHVMGEDGKPLRDCFVIVFAQDPVHWTPQTRHMFVSRPGPDDLFHARMLAGDYYIVAMTDVEVNAWTDSQFLALAKDVATKISIGDGETKSIDLHVSPAPAY